MRALARWSEFAFALISFLLWSTFPFPPRASVLWNWILLTVSVLLGIVFFIWLKRESRAAWLGAGTWAVLAITDILIGVIRGGIPSVSADNPAVLISFILVYAWGLCQLIVLVAVARWFVRHGSPRALGA